MVNLLLGLILSTIISFAAVRKNLLTPSGGFGAVFLGTSLYFFGGVFLSSILVAFFLSAAIATKFKDSKKSFLKDMNEKNGGRDFNQVLANGGLSLLFAIGYYITKNETYIIGFCTALASANSDTWSSELGVLSRKAPISIINFKRTMPGLSGSVSFLGTFAAAAGAFLIAAVFFIGHILFIGWSDKLVYQAILITVTGFLGSITDSYLGALFQGKYSCQICSKITEKKIHHNKETILVKGYRLINNDIVNFISSLLTSFLAMYIYIYI